MFPTIKQVNTDYNGLVDIPVLQNAETITVSGGGAALQSAINDINNKGLLGTKIFSVDVGTYDHITIENILTAKNQIQIIGDTRKIVGSGYFQGVTQSGFTWGSDWKTGRGIATITVLGNTVTVIQTTSNPDFSELVNGDKIIFVRDDQTQSEGTVDSVSGNSITLTAPPPAIANKFSGFIVKPNRTITKGLVNDCVNIITSGTLCIIGFYFDSRLFSRSITFDSILDNSCGLILRNCVISHDYTGYTNPILGGTNFNGYISHSTILNTQTSGDDFELYCISGQSIYIENSNIVSSSNGCTNFDYNLISTQVYGNGFAPIISIYYSAVIGYTPYDDNNSIMYIRGCHLCSRLQYFINNWESQMFITDSTIENSNATPIPGSIAIESEFLATLDSQWNIFKNWATGIFANENTKAIDRGGSFTNVTVRYSPLANTIGNKNSYIAVS